MEQLGTASGRWSGPRSAVALLVNAARMYQSGWPPLVGVALVGSMLQWLLTVVMGHRVATAVSLPVLGTSTLAPNPLLLVIALFCTLWAYVAVVVLAGSLAAGSPPMAQAAVAAALRRLWPTFLAGLVIGLVAGVGAVLLLVPTVLFGTWWAVAPILTVIERQGAAAALGRSRSLVGGLFWHVLGSVLLAGLVVGVVWGIVNLFGRLFLLIGGHAGLDVAGFWTALLQAVATPYGACFAVLLYLDLRARKGDSTPLAMDAGQVGA